jgi:hypothetical protein
MKKIFIGLFIILFHVSVYSQESNLNSSSNQSSQVQLVKADTIIGKKYSRENLRQTSTGELNLYLKNARVLKTTGLVTTIAGTVLMVTGTVLTAGWEESGPPIFLAGFITTIAGVPILITGSRRVNKIKNEIYYRDRTSFIITPGFLYSNYDQNLYPGVSLKFRF